jgi:hypothetical protein
MHATLSTTKRKRKARNGVCTSGLLANSVFFFFSLWCVSQEKERERENEKVKHAQSNKRPVKPAFLLYCRSMARINYFLTRSTVK